MTTPVERPLKAQLVTARILLGQFEEQLREWRRMSQNRRRRTARGKDLASRLDGLKAGHEKWTARVADLEARIEAEARSPEGE